MPEEYPGSERHFGEETLTSREFRPILRLQFDLKQSQLNIMDKMVSEGGYTSRTHLFHASMALMKWALQEQSKGRKIASCKADGGDTQVATLPK